MRRQRRRGARINEPEPRGKAGERPRLAKCGGERLGVPRPCADITRASSGHHSPSPAVATNCCLNTPLGGSLSAFQVERWRVWLPTSQDESGVKPSLHLMAFAACSAQPRGRHVGLGAGASLGSGSTFASNFLCGLQIPSPVWVSEMETPLSVAVTKVYNITNVKVAYKLLCTCQDHHRCHPVAFLPSAAPQPQLQPLCQPAA